MTVYDLIDKIENKELAYDITVRHAELEDSVVSGSRLYDIEYRYMKHPVHRFNVENGVLAILCAL